MSSPTGIAYPPDTNPVLHQALMDYAPDIVAVDFQAIEVYPEKLATRARVEGFPVGTQVSRMLGIPYFIVMNSLNHAFWQLDSQRFLRYTHGNRIGAYAMEYAFRQQWERIARRVAHLKGLAHTSYVLATLKAKFQEEGLGSVFGDIPEPRAREAILMEVLSQPEAVHEMASRIHGSLVIHHALDWRYAVQLAETFPLAYSDPYLKKAQLVLMCCAAEWNARHGSWACDPDVTLAADYQLPRVLKELGFLAYSTALEQRLAAMDLLESGSREERAIRAATVLAGEALAREQRCSIADLDQQLWLRRNEFSSRVFHLTRTTHY